MKLVSLFLAILLSACTTTDQLKPLALSPQQLQQLQGQVCAVVKADLLLLQSPSGQALVGAAEQAKIEKTIAPTATAVCDSGATVDLTSLQAFNNTALPALIQIVQAVPAIPNQPEIVLALQLAQVALPPLVNSAIAASQSSVAAK